jgi:hypothetical protein
MAEHLQVLQVINEMLKSIGAGVVLEGIVITDNVVKIHLGSPLAMAIWNYY